MQIDQKDPRFEIIVDREGRPRRIVRDGQSVGRHMMLMDAAPPRQRWSSVRDAFADARIAGADGHNHRPGFRTAFEDGSGSALDAAGHVLNNSRRTVADAYSAYDAEKAAEYKQSKGLGSGRQSDPHVEGGSFDLRGQKAGDACTLNGAPGRLRRGSDGKLRCIPDEGGVGFSPAVDSRSCPDCAGSGDCKTCNGDGFIDDDDDDADQIVERTQNNTERTRRTDHRSVMDTSYQQYDDALRNAWRR